MLLRKGVEITLKIAFVACIIFILVELKWLIQDQVFDRQEMDTMMEKVVLVGKRVLAQGSQNGAIIVDHVRKSELWQTIFDLE